MIRIALLTFTLMAWRLLSLCFSKHRPMRRGFGLDLDLCVGLVFVDFIVIGFGCEFGFGLRLDLEF